MKTYSKPEFFVEEFAANAAVAASCQSHTIGSETVYEQQTVYCIKSEYETVFNEASSCSNDADYLVTPTETKTHNSVEAAITYLCGLAGITVNYGGQGSSYTTTSGTQYLIWGSDGKYHAGPTTSTVVPTLGYSY